MLKLVVFAGVVLTNGVFGLIYNKAQGRLLASLLPGSVALGGGLGALLLWLAGGEDSLVRSLGWGLFYGNAATVALCLLAVVLIVMYMRS